MKNVADIYPLSSTQLGILFHTIQAPHSGVYFYQFVCTLTGELDRFAFIQAWQRVVAAQPVLKTAFIWEEMDEPLQIVRQHVEIPYNYENWQHLSPVEQQTQLASLLQSDRQRGFNLAKAPLMRLYLRQAEPITHQFIWSSHHILMDGWSVPNLLKSVFSHYESIRQNRKADVKPSRPYRDYIAWLQKQDLILAEDFWRKKLSGFTAPTPLMIDSKRENRSDTEAGYHEQQSRFDEPITTRLKATAKKQRLTLNTTIQGAWAILLSRYSGATDVVFGTTVAGRPPDLPGVEEIIGLFINTIPVRLTVSPDQDLLPWLKDIQQQSLSGRQYEYTPLVNIQNWSELPRGRSLFDSLVVFENYPTDGGSILPDNASLTISNVQYLDQSNYPLSLLVIPGKRLLLRLIYDRHRFEDKAIVRMLGHLERILTSLAHRPNQTLGSIPILTAAEETLIFDARNDTCIDMPEIGSIQELIEHQARKQPDHPAVIWKDESCSYREIDRKANQLARHLCHLGVNAGTIVGLCAERSPAMIVGILGILKAGGAYLPLDPTYPQKRLAFMLKDTEAPIIVTQQMYTGRLPLRNNTKPVCLDTHWDQIVQNSTEPISAPAGNPHLAYVIYTSGSTGQPKGVPITHKNLVHSTLERLSYYPEPVQRFLLLSSFAFDSSVAGIFWPLCQGGTLVLPQQGLEQDIVGLTSLIQQQAISHTLCLPTLYNLLLRYANPDLLASLQTVIVAGEVCPPALVQAHYQGLPKTQLYNEYGPTEGTVWSTVYEVPAHINGRQIPIGKPIPNMQAFILDAHFRPVPIGVTGELYIGGLGLAQGYLNRPDLTADRFINHTFENGVEARLYRTGDLARYQGDGNIVFLGRADQQVKIRGYRIELGEVETVLSQHPYIRESVVTAFEDRPDEKRLVAYFVPSRNQKPTIADLRHYLEQKVPDYMVPSTFVLMTALPLMPNGKIDRRALAPPDKVRQNQSAILIKPRNELELQLAKIWEKVLGIKDIGIKDNFFDLGGHSLLALHLFAQIQKVFGKDLPLTTLFPVPTIEQLAWVIRQEGFTAPWSSLVPIHHGGSKPPFFFCIHGCTGKVLHFYDLARHLGQDYPFYGLSALGLEKGQVPLNQIEDMAAHYIKEIRTIQSNGPYFIGGSGEGCIIAIEMAHQLKSQGRKVKLLTLIAPSPLKPHRSSNPFSNYYNSLRIFFNLFNVLIKNRPLLPNVKHAFLNRVLWHFKICHRFIPDDIHRWRHFTDDFNRARMSYAPRTYNGRIACFLREEYSNNHKKVIGDWYGIAVGGLDVQFVPGTFASMWQEPHVKILAEKLKACLDDEQNLLN